MKSIIIAVMLAVAFLAGCSTTVNSTDDITKTKWWYVNGNGRPDEVSVFAVQVDGYGICTFIFAVDHYDYGVGGPALVGCK